MKCTLWIGLSKNTIEIVPESPFTSQEPFSALFSEQPADKRPFYYCRTIKLWKNLEPSLKLS